MIPPSRAYLNTTFVTTSTAFSKITLDTISYDANGNFNLAQSRYICPRNGFYLVAAQAHQSQSNTGDRLLAVYRNGATASWGYRSPAPLSTPYALNLADILQCSAGDYLELMIYCSIGVQMGTGPNVSFLSVQPI